MTILYGLLYTLSLESYVYSIFCFTCNLMDASKDRKIINIYSKLIFKCLKTGQNFVIYNFDIRISTSARSSYIKKRKCVFKRQKNKNVSI